MLSAAYMAEIIVGVDGKLRDKWDWMFNWLFFLYVVCFVFDYFNETFTQ